MNAFQVFRAKQFEQERRCLGQIPEDIFQLSMKTVVLNTFSHINLFRCKNKVS